MKNKNPTEIKAIFDNIEYTYVAAEGKPLLELIVDFKNKSLKVYDPVTGKYRENTSQKDRDALLIEMGGIRSTYKILKELIGSECAKLSRKGFDVRPVFFVNGSSVFYTDELMKDLNKLESVKVAFYLCMHTSIKYDQFLKLKEIVETELEKDE